MKVRALASERRDVLVVGAALVLLAIHHVLWLHQYRSGWPLDIDEAGYVGFGLDDLRGWNAQGLAGLHDAAVAQTPFAPLVPLAATPVLAVVGGSPVAAMSVQLLFLGVLGFATLGLGRAVAGPHAGVLAALATVLLPAVLDFTRTFHFVLAATAFLTATMWALVRSDGLRRRGWTVAAGALTGVLLLSRTMTVGFLPGLGVVAALHVAAAPARERLRRAGNLALAGLATGVVTLWWYGPNLGSVMRYLVGYSYGPERAAVGARERPILSFSTWTARLSELVQHDLYVPITVVFLATGLVAVFAWRHRRVDWRVDPREPPVSTARSAVLARLTSPVATVAIVVGVSYVVLTTNSNPGTGFTVPLLPLVVTVWAAFVVSIPVQWIRLLIVGAASVAMAGVVVSKATVDGWLADRSCIRLPALDCLTVADGRGIIQRSLDGVTDDPTPEIHAERARQWLPAADAAASWAMEFAAHHGVYPVVFFASRDPLFNTNTVALAGRIQHDYRIPMGQLRSDQGGDTVTNYRRRLDDPKFGWPNLLVTVERGPSEYRPVVDQRKAAQAARSLGFELVYEMVLPDTRIARFYWLQRGPPLEE